MRRRGRPRGRTTQGEAARRRLYDVATRLVAERGYESATLREIAAEAGVSPALVYRYFPGKRAIVLELYDRLSAEYAERALAMPAGKWRERFLFALEASLAVLESRRATLQSLLPVLVSGPEEGVFSESTAVAQGRVLQAFVTAVRGARDALPPPAAEALGRLLYLAHLGVILWWLLDRSPAQRATRGLVALTARMLPAGALALRSRRIRAWVLSADALLYEALLSG